MVDLLKIAAEAEELWLAAKPANVRAAAVVGEGNRGLLIKGDNISCAKWLFARISAEEEAPADLIYMDPPYYTKTDLDAPVRFSIGAEKALVHRMAFSDRWQGASGFHDYLLMLATSFVAAREVMAETGAMWVHLDRHAVHYAKVILDIVFGGPEHFINEVIWTYKSGGSSKKRFSNKHDDLLFYAKNPKKYKFFAQKEKSYNRGLKPYRFKGVKEYRDDHGWYTQVNMKDVWEIPMVGRTSGERVSYATQKPEALLNRIIESCTEQGDFCVDLFGGAGTLAAVCENTGRRWLSVDENPLAVATHEQRLHDFTLMNTSENTRPWDMASRRNNFTAKAFIDKSDGFEGQNLLKFSLQSYEFSQAETAQFNDMDRQRLNAGVKDEPLQFILLIEFDFGGKPARVFTPDLILSGADISQEILIPIKENVKKSDILVRVVDILGGESTRYLDKV
ncbi:MAG: site-specific DNA-methyltransferase [Clostridiales Family XIII bacterium]|jgi:DNA modification methylase|nr:site-specific DNA-methyltransferase [Clostridiales Family XIII bacterium]